MINLRMAARLLFVSVCLLALTSVAHAQRQRTFVSTTGSDASADCSDIAPCRNWQRAVDLVAVGGEVVAKDSNGFGQVVINKSVTLTGEGVHAASRANVPGSIAVNVTASSATVILRYLYIENNAAGVGSTGISFTGTATDLFIENCVITGFRTGTGTGIDILSAGGDSRTYITDTVLRNHQYAITAQASGGGTARVNISRTRAENYFTIGYNIQGGAQAVVRDSFASGRGPIFGASGFFVGFQGELSMERSGSSFNASGVRIDTLGTARLSETLITNNTIGVNNLAGSVFVSFVNNRIQGNTTDLANFGGKINTPEQ